MPARERHVLVTGAAGAVGSAVCRLLSDRPEVRTVMAVDADEPTGSLGRARPVRLDVRDPRLGALVRDEQVDTVVHAQVVGGDGLDPRLAHDVDVIGTIQVLAACAAAGVERVVIRSGHGGLRGRRRRARAVARGAAARPARTARSRA
jgi:UDP-glucose 4-epimerase